MGKKKILVGCVAGLAAFLFAAPSGHGSGEPPYDLLLKGGHVVDPKNGRDAALDVAVKDGKIAEVSADIGAARAKKVILVKGLYVTPGILDIHTHVYAGTGDRALAGDASVYPDGFTFRSCVTTVADAGTSGWRNFPDFKQRVIDRAQTRVLAFVNIVGGGMGTNSEQEVSDMDPQKTAAMAKAHPDIVVGIKTAHFAGPEWVAVERAVEAGTRAAIPVMVDFGVFRPERPFQKLVGEKLRPGDFYTHMYHPSVPFFDAQGKLLPYLWDARKRGVKFDLGHGGGSFVWKQALSAVRQGWLPDSLSSDLHTGSMNTGMKDMTNVMSKFLSLDVPLAKVVEMSTASPARMIHREALGNLDVGAPADIAVLSYHVGKFGFLDIANVVHEGTRKVQCELTVRAGNVVWDLNGRAAGASMR